MILFVDLFKVKIVSKTPALPVSSGASVTLFAMVFVTNWWKTRSFGLGLKVSSEEIPPSRTDKV